MIVDPGRPKMGRWREKGKEGIRSGGRRTSKDGVREAWEDQACETFCG